MHIEPFDAIRETTLPVFDVVVIGAGPAGLAAAICSAKTGLATLVLDEQASVGGQIYRAIENTDQQRRDILGPDYEAGVPLAAAFAQSTARLISHSIVWQVTPERVIRYSQNGRSHAIQAKKIILATGAMERPFPISGWTLPGVLTAGAAQILLKNSGQVPSTPPILVGCGPLLYLLGWQYTRAGVPIRAVVDTTRNEDKWRAKRYILSALRAWPSLRKGLQMMRALREAGTPIYEAADALRIEHRLDEQGVEQASALTFSTGTIQHRLEADVILLHQGVVPNVQITQSLRARHQWNPDQFCFTPSIDSWGETDIPGIFVAGDGAGVGGAEAAEAEGSLCGLAVAAQLGMLSAIERDVQAAAWRRRLSDTMRVRPFLNSLYRPRTENRMPADDVTVCRCEEVTAGEIRTFVELGCIGPNQMKSFSRCGMGPCQGRLCGLSVTELIAQARGVAPGDVGYYRIRAPIKPLTLGELAGDQM